MLIFNKYKILEEAGKGGMGVVYKALDTRFGRIVAIKELILNRPMTSEEKENTIARFKREAETAASLHHPNIVSVFDSGEFDQKHYIVMEFLSGKNLKDYVNEKYAFDINQLISFFIQVCDGLNYAHSLKVIHRDIKPANIQIVNEKIAKVTDFGLAKAENAPSELTQDGAMFGTMAYISPEQLIDSKNVDRRADIFSLGSSMYEVFTGHNTFEGEHIAEIVYKILNGKIPSMRNFNESIPEKLENIILKTMEKDPDKRYQYAGEIINDLKACYSDKFQQVKIVVKPEISDRITLINQIDHTMFSDNKTELAKVLTKGEKVILKDYLNSNKFSIGINWSKPQTSDVEFCVMLLGKSGKLEKEDNFVFYNNLYSPCKSIRLETFENKIFRRMFEIDMDNVPNDVDKICFVVTIEGKDTLSSAEPVTLKLITNTGFLAYKIEDLTTERTTIVAQIYRYKNEWKFHAAGEGYNKKLAEFLQMYAKESIVIDEN